MRHLERILVSLYNHNMRNIKDNQQKKKSLKQFSVNNLEALQNEFYREYNVDYWLYKITLLKDSHDNYENVKQYLTKNLKDPSDEDFKRTMRTEMHFLYFQMIETLFEIIFAVASHDNRDLWLALTFSNERNTAFYSDTYNHIRELSENTVNFLKFFKRNVVTKLGKNKESMPLTQWLFYFIAELDVSEDEIKKSVANIEIFLRRFANDFSDRGEYNAFKHSLRFYNTNFGLAIRTSNKSSFSLGQSEDAIIYLEEYKEDKEKKVEGIIKVAQTTKPFDFARDYECCLIIYNLIANIIKSRKHYIVKDRNPLKLYIFSDPKFLDVIIPKTGTTRVSHTV